MKRFHTGLLCKPYKYFSKNLGKCLSLFLWFYGKKQRLKWPGPASLKSGCSCQQRSPALVHRGAKAHPTPDAGLEGWPSGWPCGLGLFCFGEDAPQSLKALFGFLPVAEENRSCVYGCRASLYNCAAGASSISSPLYITPIRSQK